MSKIITILLISIISVYANDQLNPAGDTNTIVSSTKQLIVQNSPSIQIEEQSFIHKSKLLTGEYNEFKDSQYPARNVESHPIYQILEKMNMSDRNNSLIELELSDNISTELKNQANSISLLWKKGEFESAIYQLKIFENNYPYSIHGIGISWITPKSVSVTEGIDVQIGSRTDVYKSVTDIDISNGHLFAVLLFDDGTDRGWTANISTDGGASWSETYFWNSNTWAMNDLDASVVAGYFWVGHISFASQTAARMRRFNTTDGMVDATYSFQTIFNLNLELREVAVTSNADYLNNRIYYSAITEDDSLRFFWADAAGLIWNDFSSDISDADHGLDACWNTNASANNYLYFSYVNSNGQLYGANHNFTTWTTTSLFTASTDTNHVTSIAAYQDTVMIVFEDTSSIKYMVSYTGGSSWLFGTIADGSDFHRPHITGRMDGGFGVVYLEEAGVFDPVWYRHRTYEFGTGFTTPYSINEADCYSFGSTHIEWVTPGGGPYDYGTTWIGPSFGSYFDKVGDPTGIDDVINIKATDHTLLQNYPNPFNPSTTIKYRIANLKPQSTTLQIYNNLGQLIRTLVNAEQGNGEYTVVWNGLDNNNKEVASGLYFYKLQSGDFVNTQKLLKLK